VLRLAPAALAASSVCLLTGCEALGGLFSGLPRPDARLVGARFEGLTLDAVDLQLDVEVDNPYAVDLPVVRVDAAFARDADPIFETSLEPEAPIPASGQRRLVVPLRVRFAELVAALADLELGATTPYRVDLRLGLDAPGVGPVTLPLRHTGELWVPAPPTVSVARVGVAEASVQRVRAEVVLDIDSANAVALPLSRFDYGLSLAGTPVARSAVAPGTAIPAEGRAQITIPFETNPLQAGVALLGALAAQRIDYAVEGALELQTPLGPWSLPVSASGRAPLSGR
jgi:LEA14-like dessication related protein